MQRFVATPHNALSVRKRPLSRNPESSYIYIHIHARVCQFCLSQFGRAVVKRCTTRCLVPGHNFPAGKGYKYCCDTDLCNEPLIFRTWAILTGFFSTYILSLRFTTCLDMYTSQAKMGEILIYKKSIMFGKHFLRE